MKHDHALKKADLSFDSARAIVHKTKCGTWTRPSRLAAVSTRATTRLESCVPQSAWVGHCSLGHSFSAERPAETAKSYLQNCDLHAAGSRRSTSAFKLPSLLVFSRRASGSVWMLPLASGPRFTAAELQEPLYHRSFALRRKREQMAT